MRRSRWKSRRPEDFSSKGGESFGDESPARSYYPEAKSYLSDKDSLGAKFYSEGNTRGHTFFPPGPAKIPGNLVLFENKIYLPEILAAESSIINSIFRLLAPLPSLVAPRPPHGLSLEQESAFSLAFQTPLSILTGGPGTGKTTVSAAIIRGAIAEGLAPVVMAPTGKAAMRLEEVLEGALKPSTIHRGLRWRVQDDEEESLIKKKRDNLSGGPAYNRNFPLPSKFYLIDECSMIDISLMAYLLDAIPSGSRVIFVGDPDQLPPVGPGQPFLDFIESGIIPTIRLNQIFRQAAGSSISLACQAIKRGNPSEFFDIIENSQEISHIESKDSIREISRIAASANKDIQVLSPKRDDCYQLNLALKPIMNPIRDSETLMPLAFNLFGGHGDRIQQIKNNYFKGIFNGEQAIIEEKGERFVNINYIRLGKKLLTYSSWPREDGEDIGELQFVIGARFRDNYLPYISDEAIKELTLAYCLTIHRYQGSENEEIILDLPSSALGFLSRRLFFTGLSRARRHAYIVATSAAIAKAILTHRDDFRRTALTERLRKEKPL